MELGPVFKLVQVNGVKDRAVILDTGCVQDPLACVVVVVVAPRRGIKFADGSVVQDGITQESRAGSTIEIIVDQDASTVEFRLDGAPVGKGGPVDGKLTVKPEHKRDLTPAASVHWPGSALTLVAVEAVAR